MMSIYIGNQEHLANEFADNISWHEIVTVVLGTLSIDNEIHDDDSQPKEDWVEGFVLGGKNES